MSMDADADVADDPGVDAPLSDSSTDDPPTDSVSPPDSTPPDVNPIDVQADAVDAEPTDAPDAVDVTPDASEARCDDHVWNGEEEGVDCGGPCEDCPTPIPCDEACTSRNESPGACDMEWARDELTCEGYCDGMLVAHDPRTAWAVSQCVATNPLCFEPMWQCVLSAVHPEPFRHTVPVHGVGFDRFEGAVVSLVFAGQPMSDVRTATVADGEFRVAVPRDARAADHYSGRYWVDADADGACDPTSDFVGGLFGDYDRPLVWAEEVLTIALAELPHRDCGDF